MKRRKSRDYALQILFMLDESNQSLKLVESSPQHIMDLYFSQFATNAHEAGVDREHLSKILHAILEHQYDLDVAIEKYSDHWKLSRMTRVDRNILRIAAAEIFYLKKDVPVKVAIDEAIEMAKRYGTDDSAAFINGILDPLLKQDEK